jgi:tryptophanyl-tRNA synthetase
MTGSTMRVVSGIQPTGGLHLGNLLGAILRWVRMQEEAECLFFLADLHALTGEVDPVQLRANVREMAAALIGSGSIRASRSCSPKAPSPPTPNWPGSFSAPRAWAGSTA